MIKDFMTSVSEEKQRLRTILHAKRAENQQFQSHENGRLVTRLLEYTLSSYSRNQYIAAFWPLLNEPDLRMFMAALHEGGYRVCLPETLKKTEPLQFRLWSPDCIMKSGKYGTLYPDTEIVQPDLICLPLLAFDRLGNRLGYGGGYYDRTLQKLPKAGTVGVAFSYQEVGRIPVEEFDRPLSAVITEQEIIYSQLCSQKE